ncbi:hypothetical protein TSUD_234310 [Trifolium subterraneum]|uniref:Uncharacterized protein n=1 Tax=Trifolium subterraneum TaxID=3900 RepID=A0A2Z6MUK7_TRISU|nr:hypothetical protein TSUD_234310 [Trifolium subterraneum]
MTQVSSFSSDADVNSNSADWLNWVELNKEANDFSNDVAEFGDKINLNFKGDREGVVNHLKVIVEKKMVQKGGAAEALSGV